MAQRRNGVGGEGGIIPCSIPELAKHIGPPARETRRISWGD